MEKQIQTIKLLVSRIFKNASGEPYQLTTGQAQVFLAVINPALKWLWLSAPTRYGKSEVLAMALIYLAVFHRLKVPIVAGSEDKAKRIMEYVVNHISDHPDLYRGLINIDASEVDKLKVQMSKAALRWSEGGWIYITSIDSRSLLKEGEDVVGEGGDIVVLEEAGLIRKREQFSKIVRMPEENRGWGKLIMSGNCIENSVFEDGFNDPLYTKIKIGLEQAIAEGRFTRDKLEQQHTQTTAKDWKRYYLVEFPAHNEFSYFKPKTYEMLPTEMQFIGALDPSLGETLKGSLQAIFILGIDTKGQCYEVESMGTHMTPEEAMKTIFNFQYKFNRFGIEAVQFQKYFLKTLQDKSKAEQRYIPFVGIQQSKNKLQRIESMEPIVNTGQILFKGGNELADEMADYPNTEFLDVLDSMEMAWRTFQKGKVDFAFA